MTTNFTLSPAPSLDIASKTQAPEKGHEAETAKTAKAGEETKNTQADAKRFDTFEKSSEEAASNPSGIYRMEEDENGNPKISFEKPGRAEKSGEEASKAQKAEGADEAQEPEETKCTMNTDKVDAEIKKLQERRQQIAQQLQAEKDADKRSNLEQQLKIIDSELQSKDSDAYRKQHASYTYG